MAYRYALAVLVVAAAAVLRWGFPGALGEATYLAFYPAVVIAAALGGIGPGLLATVASSLCVDLFFDATPGWFNWRDPAVVARAVIFLTGGVMTSLLAERLRRGEARERRQVEQLSDLGRLTGLGHFLVLDEEHRILQWSEGCVRLYGYTAEQAVGQVSHNLLKTVLPQSLESIRATLESEGRWEGELIQRKADGAVVNVASLWLLRPAFLGRPAVILEVNSDITARKRAEAAVRASEERFRALFDKAGVGMVEADNDRHFIAANDRACEILGYRREELLGMTVSELTAPEDRSLSEDLNAQLKDGRCERISYEKRYLRRDGSSLWAHVTVAALRDSAGRACRFIATVEDINERKAAEQALRESREDLNRAQAVARIGSWRLDVRRNDLRWSDETHRMFGIPVGTHLTYESFLERVHHEDRQYVDEHWTAALQGKPYDIEHRIIVGNEVRWVHQKAQLEFEDDGTLLGGFGTVQDITERKEAEARLHLQSAALEAAANGIAITAADGSILWANRAFGLITGYAVDELLGQNPRILKSGQQDDAFYRNMWATIRRGEVWRGELVNRRRDGSLYHEEMTITPIVETGGRISFYIAIKQNIDARKEAEEALAAAKISAEQAKFEAERANQAKDHFLAVLSHELRTPLTPVLATVSMLQEDSGLDEEQRENLEVVRRNIELEARLIDDLLDLTRIVRGKIRLDLRPVRLSDVIRMAVEVCQPDLNARRLKFNLDIGPACVVRADPARLQQVFWNLLKNAIKFTPQGGRVGICCRIENHSVVAEVNDSGEGIAPEALSRIFNAFEQAEKATARQFGGLGLGLAISRALVEMHGGSIEAYSAGKGQGASFRVRLPLLTTAEKPASAYQREGEKRGAESKPSIRILLVEDHGDTARIIQRVLERQGHEVHAAGDVAAALKMASGTAFDLLVSDLGLPDATGLDLMRQLRADHPELKGIALSGYGMDTDIQRSREAGFSEHLTKPIDLKSLHAAIERVMSLP